MGEILLVGWFVTGVIAALGAAYYEGRVKGKPTPSGWGVVTFLCWPAILLIVVLIAPFYLATWLGKKHHDH